jgi:hypothetical protein
MTELFWACAFAFALTGAPATAETVAYRVSGALKKDVASDPIYGATSDPVLFQIDFEADASSVVRVPAGTLTNLPNVPGVKFTENGFHFPLKAVSFMSFRLSSGSGTFSRADLIGDPSSPGAIFVTGSLSKPTAAHLMLANSESGTFETSLPKCAPTCRLKDGLVVDAAGPFGRISNVIIEVISLRD